MPTISEKFTLALTHFQNGNIQEAERRFREILQAEPHHAEARHFLGVIAYQQGRYDQAIDHMEKAVAQDKTNAVYLSNLGEIYRNAGRLPEAVTSLRQALKLRPALPEAHNNLGLALLGLRQLEEAKACFQQALRCRPDYAEALNNLGNVLRAQNQPVEAAACYQQAVRLQPGFVEAHLSLGNVLKEQGQRAEAAACYRQALQLEPNAAEAHNRLGLLLLEQGDAAGAADGFRRVLRLRPQDAAAHVNLGNALKALGENAASADCFRQAIRLKPDYAEAHFNLGNALLEDGRLEESLAHYDHALRLVPTFAEAHGNRGVVWYRQGRLREAQADYEEALRLRPNQAETYGNLGVVLLQQGKYDEALRIYQHLLRLQPNNAVGHFHVAGILMIQGKPAEAEASYREALRLRPDNAEAYYNLGNVQLAQNRPAEAEASFRQALRFQPTLVEAINDLGDLLLDQGRPEEAAACYQQAIHARPDKRRARIAQAVMLPPIYRSLSDLRERRQRLLENVERLCKEGVTLDLMQEAPPLNFYLAYQGFNDRDLLRDINSLYTVGEVQALAPNFKDRKIQIGFLSSFFCNHPVGRTWKEMIAKLSRRDFSVTVLALAASDDEIAREIRRQADYFYLVPQQPQAAQQMVRQLALDILFYPDIGMDRLSMVLAHSRLAPVQCVSIGHPETTGIKTIDYFISSELFEVPDADTHYTETLVRLRTLPVCFSRPLLPPSLQGRDYFGLPENAHLYGCLQTLFKIHPECDALLGEILRRDPQGLVILVRGKYPLWEQLLKERIGRTIPDVADRIRFLPWQKKTDFLNLIAVCDVLLNPPHFGGGTTSYDCFAVGAPLVSLPSPLMRSRMTVGMYKKMGILDCVADTPQRYVDLAVRLGAEPEYRTETRSKILAANSVLYDDLSAIREMEEFFKEAVAKA